MSPYDLATRAQALALKCTGASNYFIQQQTGIPSRTINSIFDRAIERGFNPGTRPSIILNCHVEDAPRPGRPRFARTRRPATLSSDNSSAIAVSRESGSQSDVGRASETQSNSAISLNDDSRPETDDRDNASLCDSRDDALVRPSTPPSPKIASLRCLKAHELMSPIFGDRLDVTKTVLVVQAGDALIRHDAVDFLRYRVPRWDGVWSQSRLPKPSSHDSTGAKFVKLSRSVAILERRPHIDDVRLRFHRIFQYQLYLRAKEEAARSGPRNHPGQTNTTVAVEQLLAHLYKGFSASSGRDKEKTKRKFLDQIRAGKRLHLLCNYFGYGIIILGGQKALNRM